MVAAEVKELATETARATELIEQVVAEVRTGTQDVLAHAEQIAVVVAEVSSAQATISGAAAVQRGAADTTQQVTDEVAQLASFGS